MLQIRNQLTCDQPTRGSDIRNLVPSIERLTIEETTGQQRPNMGHQRLPTNQQRPTKGNQRPTKGHQRLTTDHQRLTTGHQRPTKGHQRLITGHQCLTTDHQRLTKGHQSPTATIASQQSKGIAYLGSKVVKEATNKVDHIQDSVQQENQQSEDRAEITAPTQVEEQGSSKTGLLEPPEDYISASMEEDPELEQLLTC